MDDICGAHSLTFDRGSDTASVNISVVNDDIPECDETYIAHIIVGNGGNSDGQGFRLGEQSSTEILIEDEGMIISHIYLSTVLDHSCMLINLFSASHA